MSEFDLNEWLRGFVDGKGCFQIFVRNNRPFTFST
jgi:intein-encoded DNA endonuclease-like protein